MSCGESLARRKGPPTTVRMRTDGRPRRLRVRDTDGEGDREDR